MKNSVCKFSWNSLFLGFSLALSNFALTACSNDKGVAGGSTEDAGIIAVTNREIAGVSQKGPFLVGSSVTIQELNGKTLAQTGNSFKASVKSDQGDFVVKGVNLASQYALLEVNGYYRNEVTGKKSEGMIALNALTDLSDRNNVNVNLLTHLESGRVLNLVQNQGMTFAEAKLQAEREVLSSFGIEDAVEKSEDLDLFTGEGGAVLLALSVLMQGDGSAADFSERIARASFSFAESGSWQGEDKAEVVDWAFLMEKEYSEDSNGEKGLLHKVRKNVESWTSGAEAPSFEEKIYKFWTSEFGLGECGEKNYYEIRENTNAQSKFYKAKFICDDEKKQWVLAGQRNFPNVEYYVKFTDNRNDAEYSVLRFGEVNWMAENLKYAFPSTNTLNKSLCYGDESANCEVYGMLYDYESAMNACPNGFRLPTYDEAMNLLLQYGGAGKGAAEALMSMDGFGALLGGYARAVPIMAWENAGYTGMHESAVIWISTRNYPSGWNVLWIDSTTAEVRKAPGNVASVRCVGDVEMPQAKKKYGADKYMKDSRDNETYRFTEIADKLWMAENMRYKGDSMNALCLQDNGGCFYTWDEAAGSDSVEGVCPEGWRLPSREDWNELLLLAADSIRDGSDTSYVFYDGVAFKLRDFSDWNVGDYVIPEENDIYDFTAMPVGAYYYMIDEDPYYESLAAVFWTSSNSLFENYLGDTIDAAFMVSMDEAYWTTMRLNDKRSRFSVRCIKDKN